MSGHNRAEVGRRDNFTKHNVSIIILVLGQQWHGLNLYINTLSQAKLKTYSTGLEQTKFIKPCKFQQTLIEAVEKLAI
jgi:hypothetical protein